MASTMNGVRDRTSYLARSIRDDGSTFYPFFWVAIFMLLLIFGAYVRFAGNGEKLFWYDEIHTALWTSGHDLAKSLPALSNRVVGVDEFQALWRIDEGSKLPAVIEGIIRDDPQHTPLYFVALRLWAGVVGDSLAALRSLSAVADLLLLPVLYWWCLELFGSKRVAWVAMALVVISPFHFVYSQEARQYTLWLLSTALASAILLWSLRTPGPWKWCLYGLAVAAGLYTHLLFCFVVLSHAAYVFALVFSGQYSERSQGLRQVAAYSAASVFGILLFVPWIWVMTTHLATAVARVSWANEDVGVLHLAAMWAYNYSAVFLDTNHALKFIQDPGLVVYGSFLLRALVLVPACLAVAQLACEPQRKASLFLLPLILLPFLGLALPDLIMGGMRSGGGNRYLAPSFLGLELALASWLAAGLFVATAWRRKVMRGTLVLILAMGVLSAVIFLRNESWWHKTIGHFNAEVADIINGHDRPLLIAGSATNLISVSQGLDEKVRLLLVPGNERLSVPAHFSDVFILAPSEQRKVELLSNPELALEKVYLPGALYRIVME